MNEQIRRSLNTKWQGEVQINQMFFVGRFGLEHLVLHEPNERDFYTYDRAIWCLGSSHDGRNQGDVLGRLATLRQSS